MSRVIAFLPVYNEEAQIGALLDRYRAVLEAGTVEEVVAVDDGSTDRTSRSCRAPSPAP